MELGVLVALPVALVGGADVPVVAEAGADDTSRGEVARMEVGAMPSAVLKQASKRLAGRHKVGMATSGDSRQDVGFSLWLSPFGASFWGFHPTFHCCYHCLTLCFRVPFSCRHALSVYPLWWEAQTLTRELAYSCLTVRDSFALRLLCF